ncbi:MAG: NAD-dependent epimerase/dehydratase family protein, partial [Chloroflexi bacterium]|nr:NAD-dependent epimerase/dehydratase family protein [Chloroflexota bacterium]
INVLEACEQAGVRHLLYLSSTSVYGAHADNSPFLTEDSPARPVPGFQYSEDKARVESLIAGFAKRHPETTATVLRACPVMGPNADNFIASAFSKPVLVGVRGYDPPMQFLHEDDLADVLSYCLLQQVSGTYNLTGDGTILWSEMAEVFGKRLMFLPAPLLYGLTSLTWTLRLQRDSPACGLDFIRHRWTASNEKLKRELGITLRYTSREAWEAFVQRDRKHSHVKEPQR